MVQGLFTPQGRAAHHALQVTIYDHLHQVLDQRTTQFRLDSLRYMPEAAEEAVHGWLFDDDPLAATARLKGVQRRMEAAEVF